MGRQPAILEPHWQGEVFCILLLRILGSAVKHSGQDRHIQVRVVVNSDLALSIEKAMQPANILRNRSPPRYPQECILFNKMNDLTHRFLSLR